MTYYLEKCPIKPTNDRKVYDTKVDMIHLRKVHTKSTYDTKVLYISLTLKQYDFLKVQNV